MSAYFLAVLAAVPQILVDIGAIAAIFVATATASALVLKRPVRWLWNRNVAQPVTLWFRAQVQEVVNDELDRRPLTNGWGTRAVHKIAEAVEADIEAPTREKPSQDDQET